MSTVTYTLVTDGPADRVLMRIVDWALRQHGATPLGRWLDPRQLPPHSCGLVERLICAATSLPCRVLFVHRDAEREQPVARRNEIAAAIRQAGVAEPYLCIIPVRMTEAWLLFDAEAVRWAAGNPRGTEPLDLPPLRGVETDPDPKRVLHQALRTASGFRGRRLRSFSVQEARYRLADRLRDYSPLRALPAFQRLEADIVRFLDTPGGS